MKKAQVKVKCTLIYALLCVSILTLPTLRPNSADAAHTTYRLNSLATENEDNYEEEPWSKELVSGPGTS